MTSIDLSGLEREIHAIPLKSKGPGGVVGVVKDGRVVLRQAWGFADLKNRRPMTTETLMPICSISKQFTCAALLDLAVSLEDLDTRLAAVLPALDGRRPSVAELCHNQSGLRDYWALTVLHGADAEGLFRREDAKELFRRMRSTHFEPGSRYSYSNGNFRILSDLIEDLAGRPLGEVYRSRIFDPAGMPTAALIADTSRTETVGYEGNDTVGFFPAINRIYWTGDAGISASLDDMLAWESFIDRTRDEPNGLYRRLSAPQTFSDGSPASYGFGLSHGKVGEIATTGHGGALRGFRCHRLHAASGRLSVVVMFNHEADAHGTAVRLMKAALGQAAAPSTGQEAGPGWTGRYLDPETGLLVTVAKSHRGISLRFAGASDALTLGDDGIARSDAVELSRDGDVVRMRRPRENLDVSATRLSGDAKGDIAGRFVSAELDATLEIVETGSAFYGACDGFLGKGEMMPLYPVAEDVWIMSCRRSMDAPAPGDWTIQVRRDAAGAVSGFMLGCWLARKIEYIRTA